MPLLPAAPEERGLLQPLDPWWRLVRLAEVDRGVALAILARIWALGSGPVTLVLIASHMTADVQGYYYTFSSLLALQSFVELGFYLVITQFASHEWAHLALDETGRIVGEPTALARLVSLARLALKWYAAASLIFVTGVTAAGYVFFTWSPHPGVGWVGPWLTLVPLAGVQLWLLPLVSLLEGCNQVANVNLFRLAQGVAATLTLWAALLAGAGLWVAPLWVGGGLVMTLSFLFARYRRFFESCLSQPQAAPLDWRSEIWPMQWRLALSGLVNYFAFSLFSPVMFKHHGAAVAGQMGMTWQAIAALQGVALAWVHARVPRFGMLIARKEFVALDRFFFRGSAVSLAVISSGAVGLWLAVYALYAFGWVLAQRILPPLPTALFLAAAVLMQILQCEVAYLRAHKREPIVVLSVASSLAIGSLVWLLGRPFGPLGAAAGYLAVIIASTVCGTIIWWRCREKWHRAMTP